MVLVVSVLYCGVVFAFLARLFPGFGCVCFGYGLMLLVGCCGIVAS